MKIRTAAMLEEQLSKELSWRRHELITIKLTHDKARDFQQDTLRRAGIALLYAHWEGYVKKAGTLYIEYVVRQGYAYKQLAHNFVALGAKGFLKNFSETSKGLVLCGVADFFINRLNEKARIGWDGAVQTKSNLTPERTRDIFAILGLNYLAIEIYEKTVIQRLVNDRNDIAHGQYLRVSIADYDELHRKVLTLLDEVTQQITTAATNRTFKKSAAIGGIA